MISLTQRSDKRKKSRRIALSGFEYIYQDIDRFLLRNPIAKKVRCTILGQQASHRL